MQEGCAIYLQFTEGLLIKGDYDQSIKQSSTRNIKDTAQRIIPPEQSKNLLLMPGYENNQEHQGHITDDDTEQLFIINQCSKAVRRSEASYMQSLPEPKLILRLCQFHHSVFPQTPIKNLPSLRVISGG